MSDIIIRIKNIESLEKKTLIEIIKDVLIQKRKNVSPDKKNLFVSYDIKKL